MVQVEGKRGVRVGASGGGCGQWSGWAWAVAARVYSPCTCVPASQGPVHMLSG